MTSQAPFPKYSMFQKIKLHSLGIKHWDIPTHTTADELFRLYTLAKSFKTTSLAVEIGSYLGASSLMIGKGLNNKSKLYCIDTWKNDAMTEGNWDTYTSFKKNTYSVSQKIITIKANSIDAAKNFHDKVNLLFIDGDHSYEVVKNDVEAWFTKLKSGGIIIMHDAGWAEGVVRVIEEDIKPNLQKFNQTSNLFWGWKK